MFPESTWTAPRPDCLSPQHWHAPDSDSTEVEVSELLAGLVRGLQPELTIETGSCWGQTTVAIAEALADNGHGFLYSYEIDPGRAAVTEQRLVEAGLDIVVWVENESSLGVELSVDDVIDFAFFDSDCAIRPAEFRHFRRWMHPGTVVAFHDVAGIHHAHRTALEELEALGILKALYLSTPRGLALGVPLFP